MPPRQLPLEIIYWIAQSCPGKTLKSMRLASKTMAQIAEPLLWRHVVLVPNSWCIKAFIDTVKSSTFLQHVITLSYDARFPTFFEVIRNYRADSSIEQPKDDAALVESVFDRATNSCFTTNEDTSIEIAWLSKVIRMFPHLNEIIIRECDRFGAIIDPVSIPHFYDKMCTMVNINPCNVNFDNMGILAGRSYTRSMLMAVFTTGCPLKIVRSTTADLNQTFAMHRGEKASTSYLLSIYEDVVANLSILELSFCPRGSDRSLSAIQFMLSAATRLKSLSLSLGNDPSTNAYLAQDDMPSQLGDIFKTRAGSRAFKPTLPNLEYLALDGCISQEEDLIHFLSIHSSTLRHVHLSDMALLVVHERHGCWVEIIKSMRRMLQLSSATFDGWFSNGGRQHWFVIKDRVSPERLKTKVEKFVVKQGSRDCPLERVAIKPYENDVGAVVNAEEWEGDLSWTMVYNRFENGVEFFWGLNTTIFSEVSSVAGNPILPPSPPSLDMIKAKEQPPSLNEPVYNETPLQLHDQTGLQTWLPDDDLSEDDLGFHTGLGNNTNTGFLTLCHVNPEALSYVKGKATNCEWTINGSVAIPPESTLSPTTWASSSSASFSGSIVKQS
ncbi:hypothetical protein PV10_07874 [Exophiala mesophila]|uniref:F-box domain-containing protein n=1 Tax=Exophiala mesophila TaxID=212818 RepID=A0A0D1ZUW6_EXOME|nr:uncharacterized protein PV10_07874 [Exophiala mesophila]KIV90588.1 hypothetical protein PV10_07874 [Exophiala mesophila]